MLRRFALLVSSAGAALGLAWLRPLDAGPDGELPDARHERRDVGFLPMLIAGFAMLAALAGVVGVAALLFPASLADRVINLPQAPFPVPQLQPRPQADMEAFRKRQLEQLNGTYWIDRNAGRVHIPIEKAMRDVAAQGIPDWPAR